VQFAADLVPAKQHHAEKTGFQEEGRQDFITEQRAKHTAGPVRKHAPIGPELVGHHHTCHHAHRKGEREDFDPVEIELFEHLAAGLQPQALTNREEGRQTDGEGGEHDVEGDYEGELHSGEQ
jgi:hypothetical protein